MSVRVARMLWVLTLAGCGPVVARDVAGDAAFVTFAADDLVLVGSWTGLRAVDPDTGDVIELATGPVLAADLGADGRIRWTETYEVFPGDDLFIPCIANCPVPLTSAARDGTEVREDLPEVVANGVDTFVQSADGRRLAFQTPGHLAVLDLDTGDLRDDGPDATWAMDVASDDGSVVYLQASVPYDEPWQHFQRWVPGGGEPAPVAIDDDPDLVWTWRWRDGDHHALLLDRAGPDRARLAVADAATGARAWTTRLDRLVLVSTLHWSTDGRTLSFFQDASPPILTVVDTVTGAVDELGGRSLGRSVWAGATAVSPSGDRVAYEARGDLRIVDR